MGLERAAVADVGHRHTEYLVLAGRAVSHPAVGLVDSASAFVLGDDPQHGRSEARLAERRGHRREQRRAESLSPESGVEVDRIQLADLPLLDVACLRTERQGPLAVAGRQAPSGVPKKLYRRRLKCASNSLGDRTPSSSTAV